MKDSTPERRTRVRCHAVDAEAMQNSRCRVAVEVEWREGVMYRGEGEENDTAHGRIRAGALAGLAAVTQVTDDTLQLELRGVKLVRAFDILLVIVAIRGTSPERRYDLIGTTVAPEDDLARGAALAVLDATNRILERHLQE